MAQYRQGVRYLRAVCHRQFPPFVTRLVLLEVACSRRWVGRILLIWCLWNVMSLQLVHYAPYGCWKFNKRYVAE